MHSAKRNQRFKMAAIFPATRSRLLPSDNWPRRYNRRQTAFFLRRPLSAGFRSKFSCGAILIASALAVAPLARSSDLYWDANGSSAGTGGTGIWSNSNTWRNGSPTGTLQSWADGNNAYFQGTAGTVTLSADENPITSFFQITGYTLTGTGTPRTLGGSISLSSGVNLTLIEATTANRELAIGSVSGGAGSSLTISGSQTTTANISRIDISQANASIDVPITIGGTGTTLAGFVGTATGTAITGTIATSSTRTTFLGTTSGNDLTLSSTAVISGSGAVKIGISSSTSPTGSNAGTITLNAASTYSGGTTIQNTTGGTVAIGDNSAFGTGTVTFANNGGGQLIASGGARNIANDVVLAIDTTIGGSNDLTLSGSVTSSGSSNRTLTVNNNGATTISGNVYLAPDNITARGLTITGSGAITISGGIANNNAGNTVASPLSYSGSSTLTLASGNSYTGSTTVTNGTLNAAAQFALGGDGGGGTSSITINNGGTLLLSGDSSVTDRINVNAKVTVTGGGTFHSGGLTEGARPNSPTGMDGYAGMGALTLTSTSASSHATINFGAGANGSSLVFSSLSGSGAYLDIRNWTGTFGSDDGSSGNDRLLFATDPSSQDLSHYAFYDDAGALIGGSAEAIAYGNLYELVPVPEPSTWVAGALAFLAVGYTQRRRLSQILRS